MTKVTQSQGDSALRAEELCPAERLRGTHSVDHSDEAFNGLPDLTSGRTLADAIAHLDLIAATEPEAYGAEWCAEMKDIGASALRVRGDDGPKIQVGTPCDTQMDERVARSNALVKHFQNLAEGRVNILRHLEAAGSSYGFMRAMPAAAKGR